ncbi:hypothetical protein INT43_004447 [Umbelopsis isabellina]|uniref:N-acetyltransferase domain-containing protein n=1 Tax=Mortierella isabellina TaxID=91625 RepID=A0A8H7PIZ7_MORIS|nr:hypothetical protein INT43_004447 [Umbelopsis isabellina]
MYLAIVIQIAGWTEDFCITWIRLSLKKKSLIERGVKVVWFYGGDIANQAQGDKQLWNRIINDLGRQSAKTQRLASPITTYEKLISTAQHHRLYVIMRKVGDSYEAKGILKTGEKRIFHMNDGGNIEHLRYLCLLDFYVEPSVQRQGYGKILLETMILVRIKLVLIVQLDFLVDVLSERAHTEKCKRPMR